MLIVSGVVLVWICSSCDEYGFVMVMSMSNVVTLISIYICEYVSESFNNHSH